MPWELTLAILGLGAVATEQVSYEIEGWGVGELVVADGLVVWHESPWPRAEPSVEPSQTPTHPGLGPVVSRKTSRGAGSFVAEVIDAIRRYFAGERHALDDVPVDLEYETPFLAGCAAALRRVQPGE